LSDSALPYTLDITREAVSMYKTIYKSEEAYQKMSEFYDKNVREYGDILESRTVETRFGTTHMLSGGKKDAPPLILIQGMAGNAGLWHHQMADFTKHFHIFALDTPGQPGRSAAGIPSLLNFDLAYWLEDVVNELHLEKVSMVGISSGGWAIILFGILFGSRLDKAVLLSPLRMARAKLKGGKWVKTGMKKDTEDDKLEDRLTVRDFNPETKKDTEEARKYDGKLARAMALATRHYTLTAAMGVKPDANKLSKFITILRVIFFFSSKVRKSFLSRFQTNTYILMGEHEALYNPLKAERRLRNFSNIRTEIVKDSGHAVVFDRPEFINPKIIEFLLQG
jgi:pimeloyl-ACP methyl ester carboxylesterase